MEATAGVEATAGRADPKADPKADSIVRIVPIAGIAETVAVEAAGGRSAAGLFVAFTAGKSAGSASRKPSMSIIRMPVI